MGLLGTGPEAQSVRGHPGFHLHNVDQINTDRPGRDSKGLFTQRSHGRAATKTVLYADFTFLHSTNNNNDSGL